LREDRVHERAEAPAARPPLAHRHRLDARRVRAERRLLAERARGLDGVRERGDRADAEARRRALGPPRLEPLPPRVVRLDALRAGVALLEDRRAAQAAARDAPEAEH